MLKNMVEEKAEACSFNFLLWHCKKLSKKIMLLKSLYLCILNNVK